MDVLQAPIHPQAGAYRDTVVRAQGLPTLPQIDSKGHPIRGAGAADHCGTRHREQMRDDLRRVYVTNSIEFTDSGKRYQIRKPPTPCRSLPRSRNRRDPTEKLTREIVRGCRGRGVKILKHSTCATLNRRTMFSLPKDFTGGVHIFAQGADLRRAG